MDLGAVEGVTGWHISSVRRALAPRIAHRVPSMYTALYEGGEDTAWVFLTSETPRDQLRPAMELRRERGVRRWFVVGNHYAWPRHTARSARHYAQTAADASPARCISRSAPRTSSRRCATSNARTRTRTRC